MILFRLKSGCFKTIVSGCLDPKGKKKEIRKKMTG